MGNFNNTFGYMMGKAMILVAYSTLETFVQGMLKAEKKKINAALGHEPTQENWQYYRDLQQEKSLSTGSRQGETPPFSVRRRWR